MQILFALAFVISMLLVHIAARLLVLTAIHCTSATALCLAYLVTCLWRWVRCIWDYCLFPLLQCVCRILMRVDDALKRAIVRWFDSMEHKVRHVEDVMQRLIASWRIRCSQALRDGLEAVGTQLKFCVLCLPRLIFRIILSVGNLLARDVAVQSNDANEGGMRKQKDKENVTSDSEEQVTLEMKYSARFLQIVLLKLKLKRLEAQIERYQSGLTSIRCECTCPVSLDIMNHPIILMPCLHMLDLSTLRSLRPLRYPMRCPLCNQDVVGSNPNVPFFIHSVIQTIVTLDNSGQEQATVICTQAADAGAIVD